MRIIAGQARGRRLMTPRGRNTRPTTDRVREALFSIIQADIGDEQPAAVLDLFAGSGGLGIEALSRGAASAVFVEPNRMAQRCIRTNLDTAQLETKARLLKCGAEQALPKLAQDLASFSLVFLDPPYNTALLPWALKNLHTNKLLQPGALLVCEHSSRGPDIDPGLTGKVIDLRRFGEVSLTLVRTPKDEPN